MSTQIFKARVRVTDLGPARGQSRSHQLELSSVLGLGVDDSAPAVIDFLLDALGSEILLVFRELLRRNALPFEHSEIQLRARLHNPLVALGVVGETGSPGLASIDAVCHLTALFPDADSRRAEECWSQALARSVILASLGDRTVIQTRLNIL